MLIRVVQSDGPVKTQLLQYFFKHSGSSILAMTLSLVLQDKMRCALSSWADLIVESVFVLRNLNQAPDTNRQQWDNIDNHKSPRECAIPIGY